MTELFARPRFTGFGTCEMDRSNTSPISHSVQAENRGRLRQLVRRDCPRHPGVYGMVDANGELVYVGKAKHLRVRLLSYFRCKNRRSKPRRILERTAALVWERWPDEFAALLRELELIRRWRPRYNVRGQPTGVRFVYVCLGRAPAPYVFLTARPPARVDAVVGPISAGLRAREAVRRLNDQLKLRDCPRAQTMAFADQGELFTVPRGAGCLRLEIGTCLGPCAGSCTTREYGLQVRAARAFLNGDDESVLRRLREEMTAASAGLQYERAAALRDRHEPLRWLWDRLERLRQAQEQLQFVYSIPRPGGTDTWYLVRLGLVAAALPAPRDSAERRAAASIITRTFGQPRTPPPARPDQLAALFLIAAWFRRAPAELDRTMTPDQALRHCREAGMDRRC